jgi:hypothetical protein
MTEGFIMIKVYLAFVGESLKPFKGNLPCVTFVFDKINSKYFVRT